MTAFYQMIFWVTWI